MGSLSINGRQRDFLLTSDLASFYGVNDPQAQAAATDAIGYYNRPEPKRGNRRQRRAVASQKRRKKT